MEPAASADSNTKTGGNLRHLIVEACTARNLMDTSVYFWPGFVSTSVMSLSDSSPLEKSPWLTFTEENTVNAFSEREMYCMPDSNDIDNTTNSQRILAGEDKAGEGLGFTEGDMCASSTGVVRLQSRKKQRCS